MAKKAKKRVVKTVRKGAVKKRVIKRRRLKKSVKTGLLVIALIIIGTILFTLEKDRVHVEETLGQDESQLKGGEFPLAPNFEGITGFLNTEEFLTMSDLRGKVVLVDFWTYTCINCIRTLPYLQSWHEKYKDMGLVIIGVHTPEFPFEREYENVLAAASKYGLTYPIYQDNSYQTWRAYKNNYWPRKYLIDTEGFIRYDHIGEGAYEETEKMIQALLKEKGEESNLALTTEDENKEYRPRTPELYLGANFALPRDQNIGNEGGLQVGKIANYTIPQELIPNQLYLAGSWESKDEHARSVSDGVFPSGIILGYMGSEVNMVVENLGEEPFPVEILRDGDYISEEVAGDDVQFVDGRAFVLIDDSDIYNIVRGDYGRGIIIISSLYDEFAVSAFTFG